MLRPAPGLPKEPSLHYPDRSVRLDLCGDDYFRKNQKLSNKTSAHTLGHWWITDMPHESSPNSREVANNCCQQRREEACAQGRPEKAGRQCSTDLEGYGRGYRICHQFLRDGSVPR